MTAQCLPDQSPESDTARVLSGWFAFGWNRPLGLLVHSKLADWTPRTGDSDQAFTRADLRQVDLT